MASKYIQQTHTFIQIREEYIYVGPEMPESCHEILHALINKPIDFKVFSSVEVIRLMK